MKHKGEIRLKKVKPGYKKIQTKVERMKRQERNNLVKDKIDNNEKIIKGLGESNVTWVTCFHSGKRC